ncbi:alanine racemase [Nocardia sp. NPDC004068]|uniref:alanine racemase n=1 Tax=Nocardia sp. NPDC004068 TaxID=3364303 RepID=UPI00367AAACC
MTGAPPALPAAVPPLVRAFLNTPGAVEAAVERFGSPAHLLFPQVYLDNLGRLRDVLDRHRIDYRICYAFKVNRSRAFLRTAEASGLAVDVASEQEWAAAREAGFDPARIEVTGPKGERFLRALIGSGVTVNVDNLWELERLAALGDGVPVLVRVSGFPGSAVSRFGIALAEMDDALAIAAAHRDRINLRGFAFHLDSGATAERVRAAQECLGLIERAYTHGLAPTVLDLGGGLRQVFTADPDRFDAYVARLRAALLGRGEPMAWGGNTFGFHMDDTGVHGTPVFHKYANAVPATAMLDDLLAAPLDAHAGRGLAQVAAENLLELWLEPGKALVDQAGITVATVEFVKRAADGSVLVNLDIGRDTVTPADQEVMMDPVLVGEDGPDGGPVGVFLAGRLCLERDMISNHKVWFPRRPRPGDHVVFVNTAAYHTDLSAAGASMHPLPPKVAVVRADNGFRMCPDGEYEPALVRS